MTMKCKNVGDSVGDWEARKLQKEEERGRFSCQIYLRITHAKPPLLCIQQCPPHSFLRNRQTIPINLSKIQTIEDQMILNDVFEGDSSVRRLYHLGCSKNASYCYCIICIQHLQQWKYNTRRNAERRYREWRFRGTQEQEGVGGPIRKKFSLCGSFSSPHPPFRSVVF